MISHFKNESAAMVKVAESLGGKTRNRPAHVAIGEDASIEVRITGNGGNVGLRATVYRGTELSSSDRHSWTSIKVKRVMEAKPDVFRQAVDHYEGDLDALIAKLRPILEPLKGYAARTKAVEDERAAIAERNRLARLPIVQRLVELELASYDNTGIERYAERNQEQAKVVTHPARKYRIRCRETDFELTAIIPFHKAEKILAFLKEELG